MKSDALADAEFHRRAESALEAIEASIDQWLDQGAIDIDSHRTGGLLELSFPNGSKIVINTQPPLRELWLAVKGGGFHYRYDVDRWRDTRNESEFFETLSRHASEQAGAPLIFAEHIPPKSA